MKKFALLFTLVLTMLASTALAFTPQQQRILDEAEGTWVNPNTSQTYTFHNGYVNNQKIIDIVNIIQGNGLGGKFILQTSSGQTTLPIFFVNANSSKSSTKYMAINGAKYTKK